MYCLLLLNVLAFVDHLFCWPVKLCSPFLGLAFCMAELSLSLPYSRIDDVFILSRLWHTDHVCCLFIEMFSLITLGTSSKTRCFLNLNICPQISFWEDLCWYIFPLTIHVFFIKLSCTRYWTFLSLPIWCMKSEILSIYFRSFSFFLLAVCDICICIWRPKVSTRGNLLYLTLKLSLTQWTWSSSVWPD